MAWQRAGTPECALYDVLSPYGVIPAAVLPAEIRRVVFSDEPRRWTRAAAAGLSLKEVEKQHVLRALEEVNGHRRRAAEALGTSLKTLYNRPKEYRTEDGLEEAEDWSRDGTGPSPDGEGPFN